MFVNKANCDETNDRYYYNYKFIVGNERLDIFGVIYRFVKILDIFLKENSLIPPNLALNNTKR